MITVEKMLDRIFPERNDITRGWQKEPYLTRWIVWGRSGDKGRKAFLHRFVGSDFTTYHDHPWPFLSIILSGGYYEHSPRKDGTDRSVWYPPGSMLYRPATWKHWIEVPERKTAWTLLVRFRKVRSWGFWCPSGFIPWREHAARYAKGLSGCPD